MKRDKQSKNKTKLISIFDTHGKKSNGCSKMSRYKIGLREENYEKILIGNNFVTDDVLIERNVTPYDFDAFWVTVPQYVTSPI